MDTEDLLSMCLDIVCCANIREQARTRCISQDSVLDMQDIVDSMDIGLDVNMRGQAGTHYAALDGAADVRDSLGSSCRVDVCCGHCMGADVRGHVEDSWPYITRLGLSRHAHMHQCMPDPDGRLCGCEDTAVHNIHVQDIQGRHKTCHVHGHCRHFQHAAGQAGCQWDGPRHPRTNQPPPRHHMCLDLEMSRPPPDKTPFLIVWLTAACKHRLPCLS